MDDVIRLGPFDSLLELPGIDGPEDIFPNMATSDGAENPFAMGSSTSNNTVGSVNPFAGENFWNIFAGGVNPSYFSLGGDNSNAW